MAFVDGILDHLEIVRGSPQSPLNQDLFEEVIREKILDTFSTNDKLRLIDSLASTIPALEQDPKPAAELLTAVLKCDDLPPFREILDMQPEEIILGGLYSSEESLNELVLALLGLAETQADVWLLAGKRDIIEALVVLWLTTSRTSVAEHAGCFIEFMLETDGSVNLTGTSDLANSHNTQAAESTPSSGLIWRRIFRDKDIYERIYAACSLSSLGTSEKATKAAITTAQGRLLGILTELLYSPEIWESQVPEVERKYGVPPGGGILAFAMLKAVDWEDDPLMHMNLMEFFAEFVQVRAGVSFQVPLKVRREVGAESSLTLDMMIETGLHQRTVAYYLQPEADDIFADHLYGSAAQYIENYAKAYTAHFRKHMADRVMQRAEQVLSSLSRSAWANQRAPVHELRMLATIPRQAVLGYGQGSALLAIPVSPPNESALSALATVFKGPGPDDDGDEEDSEFWRFERASARALFFLYTNHHTNMWSDIIHTASVTASTKTALAAVRLVRAVVDSSWEKLPLAGTRGLISESWLAARCTSQYPYLPHAGSLVVLTDPAVANTLPFLLTGPDNSSADAYSVAVEKHDILPVLRRRLELEAEAVDEGHRPAAWTDMLALLRHRQSFGPLGGEGITVRIPNPEVGTMEL